MRHIENLSTYSDTENLYVLGNDIGIYTSDIVINGSFLFVCFSGLQIHYHDYSIMVFSYPSNVEIQT